MKRELNITPRIFFQFDLNLNLIYLIYTIGNIIKEMQYEHNEGSSKLIQVIQLSELVVVVEAERKTFKYSFRYLHHRQHFIRQTIEIKTQ